MNVETRLKLDKFLPRPYQRPLFDAILNKGYKRVLCIWPRRAGKDQCAFQLCIRKAIEEVQTIFYIFPTFASGRRILWDAINNDGQRVLDYCPPELAERNEQMMRLKFTNGSVLQVIGSNDYDNLVGTNAKFMVFSEYSLQDPRAYQFARPILTGNQGTALFLSTPRGRNHLWDLYQIAALSKNDWYVSKLTVDDTGHINLADIRKEVELGELSEGMVQQEYWTSFDEGQDGYFYSAIIDKMRLEGRIGKVPWEPGFKVNTAWDLGINDPTCILWFSIIGNVVHVIDYYSASNRSIDHFVNIVLNKPYTYGKHFPPHDIMVREQGSGLTRREMYKQLGINFSEVYKLDLLDGIEQVKIQMPRIWIDETKCKELIKHLSHYRQEWDEVRKRYKQIPLHDEFSHACFTGDTLVLTRSGMRQIMLIQENDEVLTLEGWKKCSKAMMTQANAKLVEVTFNDGTKVRCTPDHLFLTTNNGWRSAEKLMKNSKIQSSLMNSLSTLTELCIDYGRMRDIFRGVPQDSIERCGKKLLGQFQRIVTYITETMIPITTISGISNVYHHKSILDFLDQITQDFQMLLGTKQQNGIDRTQEDFGISAMLKKLKVGRNGKDNPGNALIVNQSLMVLYAQMGINKSFATRIAKHPIIVNVKSLDYREDVWDITVPATGHFSLQNGATVHNCDAFRYMCVALKKASFDGSTPDQIDRRYREAMYGDEHPSVFNQPRGY